MTGPRRGRTNEPVSQRVSLQYTSPARSPSTALVSVVLAGSYFCTGWLGTRWSIEIGFATLVWPPSGIALAAVLLFGRRAWPGIFVGELLVDLLSRNTLGASLPGWDGIDSSFLCNVLFGSGMAVGASLQAVVSAYLVRRTRSFPGLLASPRDVLVFYALAGPVGCLISASIGTGILVATGKVSAAGWPNLWATWWAGDTLGVLIFAPVVLVWWVGDAPARKNRAWPVTLVLLISFVFVSLAYGEARRRDTENVALELQRRADDIAGAFDMTLQGHLSVLAAMEGFFTAVPDMEPQRFRTFTAMVLNEYPGLQALNWSMRFSHEKRAEMERLYREYYGPDAGIVESGEHGMIPAHERAEYISIVFTEPLAPNFRSLGFDVLSDNVSRAALDRARDTGLPATTERKTLVQETGNQVGFVIVRPHYRGGGTRATVAQRRRDLVGYHGAVFRIGALVESMYAHTYSDVLRVVLHDRSAPEDIELLYDSMAGSAAATGEETGWRYPLLLPGRRWDLEIRARPEYLQERLSGGQWQVFVPGVTISGLLGLLVLLVTGRRLELESLVAARTRDLEQATRVKADFLATMSHEIRTPMNGVIGMTELVLDGRISEANRYQIEAISASGELLLTVIDDILHFSKLDAGKVALDECVFELQAWLDQAVMLLEPRIKAKGLAWRMVVDERIARRLRGDGNRIKQVLINLLGNAVKFTSAGSVELRLVLAGDGQGGAQRIRFEVIDTGIGIPADQLDSIFSWFTQADASTTRVYGGTGLGLSICKKLVEDVMHGVIGVDSAVGKGSRFWFEIELAVVAAEPAVAPEPGEAAPAAVETGVLRVLLVEDNPINQKVARAMMERLGHTVDVAGNGVQAVDMVCANDYDLVLMDWMMPEMDGLEATRHIRALGDKHDALPIIAMTANVTESERAVCLQAGMNDFMAKPVKRAVLAEVLARWTRAPAARDRSTA